MATMFSELAQGSCSWDGSLTMDNNDEHVKRASSYKLGSSHKKMRCSASSSMFLRQRSALTTASYMQSETRPNELLLPKTYITRTGHLLLFAVIDNELFALVDQNTKDSEEAHKRKNIFGENAELLSHFKSLEEFVLSVLDYTHEKEKHLYASANKRIHPYQNYPKHQDILGEGKEIPDISGKIHIKERDEDHIYDEEDQNGSVLATKVTVGSSRATSIAELDANTEKREESAVNKQEFDHLALPGRDAMKARGKLRSPMLERKSATITREEDASQRKYFQLSIQLKARYKGLAKTSRGLRSPDNSKMSPSDFGNEFLYSVRSYKNWNNDAVLPRSVQNIVRNITENDSSSNKNWKFYRPRNFPNRSYEDKTRTASAVHSARSSVLPFTFDGEASFKRGYSAILRSRHSSALSKSDRPRSISLQEIKNINLNPRIASSKPAPEKRALGVTPSAISFTSEEFSRLLEIKAANKFSLNFPVKNSMLEAETITLENITRDVRISDGTRTETRQEQDLILNAQKTEVPGDVDPILREGSVLSIAEANRIMGLDFNGNETESEKRLYSSFKGSSSSFLGEDDDEDRILFSYISPSLRKGSWNPMLSFSFESSSERLKDTFSDSDTGAQIKSGTAQEINSFADLELSREVSNCEGIYMNSQRIFKDSETPQPPFDGRAIPSLFQSIESLQLPFAKRGASADEIDGLHEVLSVRSISPKPLLNNSENENDLENSKPLFDTAGLSPNENEYEQQLILGPPKTENNPPVSENVTEDHRKRLASSQSVIVERQRPKPDPLPKHASTDVESLLEAKRGKIVDQQSSFSSNTATNISVRDSIPDASSIMHNASQQPRNESRNSKAVSGVSSQRSQSAESDMHHPVPPAWLITSNNEEVGDRDENFIHNATENAVNKEGGVQTVICNETNVGDATFAENDLQENVVDEELNIEDNLKKVADPIITVLTQNHEHVFVENSVFGTKQLVKSKTYHIKSENASKESNQLLIESDKEDSNAVIETTGTNRQPDSKQWLAINKRDGNKQEEGTVESQRKKDLGSEDMSPLQKPGKQKKDDVSKRLKKPATDKNDKPTVELKIDLKVTADSSPENGSAELEKPVQIVQSNLETADESVKSSLRLDGVGEGEVKDENNNFDELKLLQQQKKTLEDTSKAKKKTTERTPLKRNTPKQKKKRGAASRQSSISKKGTDSKNLSPVLDLPKKMETVETMIGRPNNPESLMKPSPDTEPEAVIEREVTFENQLEIKETTKNVRVQNVEVKKVAEIDPEKRDAYPPSKPKRGGRKNVKKSAAVKEQSEEKLKYEEQMRMLKEKEIEQQRAREAAMVKHRLLEEEKERYKEEEEAAKQKEDEARKKLADAKVKAKEEREAKRVADAEKKRQLVEQRREERRQKEIELAEKEKAAERLKYEKERRAFELKEQRERLKEQERFEEEQLLEKERLEELKREEEEKRREEEKIQKAQEELERLIEEREYREQLRRVAEAQEVKMREVEEQRRFKEEQEQQRIAEERERLKRAEYLKLQAELERQKEADSLADERRQMMLLKAAKRKAELLKRREENMERMFDLKCKRSSQGLSRSFTFTYFVHIPRSVWELPIGWSNKKGKSGSRGKNRPISVSASMRSSK